MGQFQPNLAQNVLWKRGFQFYKLIKGPVNSQKRGVFSHLTLWLIIMITV